MPAKKTKLRYVGGRDVVTVHLPSGDTATVARDATVELLAGDAKHLVGGYEAGGVNHPPNPNWEPVTTRSNAKKEAEE